MTIFDSDDSRPVYGFDAYVRSNALAWIGGFVIFASTIFAFAYEKANWGAVPGTDTAGTHSTTETSPPPKP
jgi:hypothetical protein